MKKKKHICRGGNLNLDLFSEHITIINNNLVLCLVCKESLTKYDPCKVSAHLLSSKHQENKKILFKMCVPDELCDSHDKNCMMIISKSVFDLSTMLKNETSYVHCNENYIVCLVCQDIICRVTHCDDTVKDNIVTHLQSETHLNSIKNNVCWVYKLDSSKEFLIFHSNVMFCSVCKQKYLSKENALLQSVVNHLLTEHPQEVTVVDKKIINDCDTGTEIIKQTKPELLSNRVLNNVSHELFEERIGFDAVGNNKALFKSEVRDASFNTVNFGNLASSLEDYEVSIQKINKMSNCENETLNSSKIEITLTDNVHPFLITVPCSKKFTFCAVCKDVAKENDTDFISSDITYHLQSPKHQENIESLTYQCMPDPFSDKRDNKYNELALVLNNNTGCVIQSGNYLSCLICKNTITNITQPYETIRYDLVYHFNTKQHLNSMRENTWWFYYLKFSEDFVAFYDHINDCNKCASIVDSIPDRVVQCVNIHLQAEGKTRMNPTNKCENSIVESNVVNDNNINNRNMPTFQSMDCIDRDYIGISDSVYYSKDENNSAPCGTSKTFDIANKQEYVMLSSNSCSEISLDKHGKLPCNNRELEDIMLYKGLEGNTLIEKPSNHQRIFNPLTKVRDLKTEHSDPFDKCNLRKNVYTTENNILMCSECQDVVEIYNNDPDFSIDLHLEKHKDFSDINHLKIEANEGDMKYTCPECVEEVPIFNKDIELSIRFHGCNTIEKTPNQSIIAAHDVSLLFNHLPESCKDHCDFIFVDGDDFYCTLCNCTVISSSNFEESCKIVQNHISELYHIHQFNARNIVTIGPISKIDKKIDPWNLFNNNNDPDSLSLMNSVIEENKQYIGKREMYYFCKICKCCFLPFGNDQEVLKIFASHFLCKNHKKKYKKYLNGKSSESHEEVNDLSSSLQLTNDVEENYSKVFGKLNSLLGYQLNSEYLVRKSNTVYCELCKISFPCEVNKIRKHCYSESHSIILVENAEDYITNYGNKQMLNATSAGNERFVNVLKNIAITYYRTNNPTITPNLIYIGNNGKNFVCLLCNKTIQFFQNGTNIVTHFLSEIHKQKTYALNCSGPLRSVCRNPQEDQLQGQKEVLMSTVGNENVITNEKETPTIEKEIKTTDVNISDFFEKLPEDYSLHRDYFSMEGENIFCQLCSLSLLSKKNFETDCKILQDHMSSRLHREQYVLCNSNGMSTGSGYTEDKDPWERFDSDNSFETRLEVQKLNEMNKEYLNVGKIYFTCSLCFAYFLYFDEQDMRNTFAAHCLTSDHKKNLKRNSTKIKSENESTVDRNVKCHAMKVETMFTSTLSDGCEISNDISSVLKKATKSPFVMLLNKHYLRAEKDTFFCDVCQVFIEFTENGSHLKKHCYSQTHNNILIQNSIKFVEGLNVNYTSPKLNTCESKFKRVLKRITKTSYKQRHYGVTANLFFINCSTTEFICYLCDKKLKFVFGHIVSKMHAEKVVKLTCISRFHTSVEDTSIENASVEKIKDAVGNNLDLNNSTEDLVMSYIVDSKRACQENVKLSCTEHKFTSENHEDIHESGCKLHLSTLAPIKDHTDHTTSNISTSPLHFKGTFSLLDEEFEVPMQSKRFEEVLELKSNDSSSIEAKTYSEDSGNNLVMCHNKPVSLLTWDFVDIEILSSDFDDNVDYVCPDCKEIVRVIDKDIRVSYQLHYKSCHSNIEELLSTNKVASSNIIFIRDVFDCLPDFYQRYITNVMLQNDTLYCNLCKSFIKTERTNIFEYVVQLHFHFSSKLHIERDKLQLAEADLNIEKLKYEPEVQIVIRNDAPEYVKIFFSNRKNTLQEVKNIAESLTKEMVYNKITDGDFKFLNYGGHPIKEPSAFVDDFGQPKTQCFKESEYVNRNSLIQSEAEEEDDQERVLLEGKIFYNVSYVMQDLFKKFPSSLVVHQEFFTLNENRVTCNLCSVKLKLNECDVKRHVTHLTHKFEFLAALKRNIRNDMKHKVNNLKFVKNQLYCDVCFCYITPWNSFETICHSVISHFELSSHSNPYDISSNYTSIMDKQEKESLSNDEENNSH